MGSSSVRIRLEKQGYESFEQTITGADPISINLMASGAPVVVDAAAAPAPKPVHHRKRAPAKSDNADEDNSPPPSDLAPDPD